MRTHVSYDGYLQRVLSVMAVAPYGGTFVSYGRLVSPKGSYVDAPCVALYQTSGGFVAVK